MAVDVSVLTAREALLTVLDQVDYTRGACSPTEMVGAVLPRQVIELARNAAALAAPPASADAAVAALVAKVARKFGSFGGGRVSDWNPLTHALKDERPMFGLGVDIEAVVRFILAGGDEDAFTVAQFIDDSWTGRDDEPVLLAAQRILARRAAGT